MRSTTFLYSIVFVGVFACSAGITLSSGQGKDSRTRKHLRIYKYNTAFTDSTLISEQWFDGNTLTKKRALSIIHFP